MSTLDPSYLRYIYDSILSEAVSPENESSLPDGLVGLYEENFPEAMPAAKRQRLLTVFAQCALLRKEVSVEFMAEITGLPVDEIRELIGTYSSWFNSPETGKYILFHERIRSYFLQKLSENKLRQLNERLIIRLQKAIKDQEKDEFDLYALQFLSDHLLTEAFTDFEKGNELLAFNKKESNWNRQIRLSNQFKWTENSIKNSIRWTAKFQPEETVMGYLDLVELQYKEKNDAENIVALVANNEMELALKRIDSFAGNDKEGLQRKFTLYMLCLMELTLLGSKDKPFRKSAIEKLLKHLDDNIPANQFDLINWNDFFPSYLMFKMASEWAELGVDYLVVYKRTDNWESEWIGQKGPYSDLEFEVLLECVRCINNKREKTNVQKSISIELAMQGKIKDSLDCVMNINEDHDLNNFLIDISIRLAKIGKIEEAFRFVDCINEENDINRALESISSELSKQGKTEEALRCVNCITNEHSKNRILAKISIELSQNGIFEHSFKYIKDLRTVKYITCELKNQARIEEAISILREALISATENDKEFDIIEIMKEISCLLSKRGQVEEAASLLYEAFARSLKINNEFWKNDTLRIISIEFIEQGNIEGSYECVQFINDEFGQKSHALKEISIELVKKGMIKESLEFIQDIDNDTDKNVVLKYISIELAKQGKVNEAFESANYLKPERIKINALTEIAYEMAKRGKIEEVHFCIGLLDDNNKVLLEISRELAKQGWLKEALNCAKNISDGKDKANLLKDISAELVKQGQVEESLECALSISYVWEKSNALQIISSKLAKQVKIKEAIKLANEISSNYWKSLSFRDIYSALVKALKLNETVSLMVNGLLFSSRMDERIKTFMIQDISFKLVKQGKINEGLFCVNYINNKYDKDYALKSIVMELSRNGKIKEAKECSARITNNYFKSLSLIQIFIEIKNKGNQKDKDLIFSEALINAQSIVDKSEKVSLLKEISCELAQNGQFIKANLIMKEAHLCAHSISSDYPKCIALKNLSNELVEQGNLETAEYLLEEALEVAENLNVGYFKCRALKEISIELSNLEQFENAALLLNEAKECSSKFLKDEEKNRAFQDISNGLIKLLKIKEAIILALDIRDNYWKSIALKNISIELSKKYNYLQAEQTCLEIPQIAARHDCWKEIAKTLKEQHGWEKALELLEEFKSEEARTFYLKGWAERITLEDMSEELIQKALPLLAGDRDSIEELLQLYAIHQLFFEEPSKERIARYNKTLNIQWALDIKAQFPE
jgi:hypothetical protein